MRKMKSKKLQPTLSGFGEVGRPASAGQVTACCLEGQEKYHLHLKTCPQVDPFISALVFLNYELGPSFRIIQTTINNYQDSETFYLALLAQ